MMTQQQNSQKFLIKLLLIILSQCVMHVNAEFYSSMHSMTKLLEHETKFVNYMEKFITQNEEKLDYLKMKLSEMEMERQENVEGSADYFDNPVNQYMLTKRLTSVWERIQNLMELKSGQKALDKLDTDDAQLPAESEISGAAEGFLRLQEVYRLRTKDMASGTLKDITYSTKLEPRHCFDIGKYGLQLNKYRLAHSWLKEASERLEARKDEQGENFDIVEDPSMKSEVLLLLADTQRILGDYRGANETFTELVHLRPESEAVAKAYAEFSKLVDIHGLPSSDLSDEHEAVPADLMATDQFARYRFTCSGHIHQSPSEERELRCGYLTETHPFLTLAPIKVEELNHDPLLVVFYDVISDKEIEIVKKMSSGRIQRATVIGQNGSIVSSVRTSQFTFLPRTAHEVLETIDIRVQDMTNLNMNYAEDHQFANYGIGGHYGQHHDFFRQESFDNGLISNSIQGNRIATVLFYLSDVEQGGGTAFPYLKRLLLPKKGSAAFWYNLHASGKGDERSLHGACPIIVGSKWVQNRWIRENIQDKRPCELYDDKVYGPF